MKKTIYSLLSATLLLFSGCSETDIPFQTNASMEENEEYRISFFDIDPSLFSPETLDNISYANLKSGFFDLTSYPVELSRKGATLRCGLRLHGTARITDGEYLLTFSGGEDQPLPGMMKVTVANEHVVSVAAATSNFSLRNGSGTQSDPYIIGSARDFLTFLDDLRENELTNGRDLWFRQTADIALMDQSSTKPGRGYFGYSFAGHYDGGGFSLMDMYYRGAANAEADSNIGIFPSLLDGATVSNLNITGVNISNVYQDVGALAGTTIGTVAISGVKIQGTIISDDASLIGGLIGRVSQGSLSLTDLTLSMTIVADSDVGGIIGNFNGSNLSLSGLSVSGLSVSNNYHFSVEGYDATGGVIGSVSTGTISISGVNLAHVVSKEDADVRTIRNTGGYGTGGIIGSVSGASTTLTLSDVTVACPVGSNNPYSFYIGGLIGIADCGKDLTIDGGRVTSVVSGATDVGGYIGCCKLTNGARLVIKGDSKTNYIIPDDSAAAIEAVTNGGGAFGYYEGTSPEAADKAIRIAITVDASDKNSGGAIGQVNNSTFHLPIFNMTSTTMQVTGGANVGGLVGSATHSTLTGSTPFNYAMSGNKAVIPSKDDFESLFSGTVKGKKDVGGILGHGENVTLKAMAAACSVTSLGGDNIGGIAGYVSTSGRNNRFEDLVSRSSIIASSHSAVGGIFGYFACDDCSYVTDCINFGEVKGGDFTGGIFGHYDKYLYADDIGAMQAPEIHWSLNAGEVTGSNCVGGVIGKCSTKSNRYYNYGSNLILYKCGNNGKIISHSAGASASGLGGIIGYGDACIDIRNCSNNATILSSENHKGVGGIAGSLGIDPTSFSSECQNVKVLSCVNRGTIDSQNSSTRVGGVLGFMEEGPESHLYDCLNTGKVLNKHNSDNGGILGYVDHLGKIYRCVNLGNVEHGNATIGTHKSGSSFYHDDLYYLDGTGSNWPSATKVSAADIGKKESFPGLNFNGVWSISSSGPDIPTCPF